MDKSGAGVGFLRELRFPLPIYIPSASPHSSSLSPEAGTVGQELTLASQSRIIKIFFFYSPASHRGGPGSNPGLVMWCFVMDKSGAGAGFLRELRFPLPICFSTIIFAITRGWHSRPGVAAVPIASQSRIKKNFFFYSPASHRGGPGSNPGLVMWGFVMDKIGAGAVFLRELRFPLPICFSTIFFAITRGWHSRAGVAAVPMASQTK
jgi:hypothetical protein